MTSRAWRNLAAECRAVEEGHTCRLDRERGRFLVKAESSGDRTYELTASGVVLGESTFAAFSCTCPAGANTQSTAGSVACKHQALVARRLEREGIVALDGAGMWRCTDKVQPDAATSSPARPVETPELCAGCGEIVDWLTELPVARQRVIVGGLPYHRMHAPEAVARPTETVRLPALEAPPVARPVSDSTVGPDTLSRSVVVSASPAATAQRELRQARDVLSMALKHLDQAIAVLDAATKET